MNSKITICAVQAIPAMFDKQKGLLKVKEWTEKIMKEQKTVDLIVFPEAFIPGYPRGLTFGFKVGSRTENGRKTWKLFYENSIQVPSQETDFLCQIAQQNSVNLVIGIVEQAKESSTLYCSLLYISKEGKLLGTHRKLKPTGSERLLWGQGDASSLIVADFPSVGRVGGLICWENFMPLARMAIYAQQPQIYLAPTADARPTWQALMTTIAHESRCFVVGVNQFQPADLYKSVETLLTEDDLHELKDLQTPLCSGGSVIVDPYGNVIAGPLLNKEGYLTATVDLGEITKAKLDFDVIGHYSSSEIFSLNIDSKPKHNVVHFN